MQQRHYAFAFFVVVVVVIVCSWLFCRASFAGDDSFILFVIQSHNTYLYCALRFVFIVSSSLSVHVKCNRMDVEYGQMANERQVVDVDAQVGERVALSV